MNGTILFLAALILLLGLGLAVVSVADHRRAALRAKISHSIGTHAGPADAPASIRLDSRGRENKQAAPHWLPGTVGRRLEAALAATGSRLTITHLLLAAAASGLVAFLFIENLLALGPFVAFLVEGVVMIAVPVFWIRLAQARFQAKFLDGFPDALDLIVRAVRAGLPVGDAIESVATEIKGPVGAEFARIRDGMKIGLDLEELLTQAAERVWVVEFRFFVVALALQRQTGGNLAETLENLSMTIRRRRELDLKARAMTSETRASAWLIGILPFFGGGAMLFLSPNYIQMLFTDPRGKFLLGTAIVLLAIGAYVMRAMIRWSMR